MLEQLLNEIKKGTTTSPITLAERLDITPRMVEAMLETLEQMGYLESIDGDCGDKPCGTCPVAGMCAPGNSQKPRIWVLKNKLIR